MDQYIRKKYLEELLDYYLNSSNGAERYGYNIIKGEIGHAPIADIKEVKHGQWIVNNKEATCSSCKFTTFEWVEWAFNYCPHCGARMDGGISNE